MIPEFSHRKLTAVALSAAGVVEGNQVGTGLTLVGTPCGVRSVIICLDLCQDAATDRLPLDRLPIDWLWVPSLSAHTTAHRARAAALSARRPSRQACRPPPPRTAREGRGFWV